jgi:hypothetical protein
MYRRNHSRMNDIDFNRAWLRPCQGERRDRDYTASEATLTDRRSGELLALFYCPGVMQGWQVYTRKGTFKPHFLGLPEAVSWALDQLL